MRAGQKWSASGWPRPLPQRGYEVVLLSAAVTGESRKEQMDGYKVIRRGSRFTVYPWALLWLLLHRKQIVGVIDSQNGIPFFSPLAVRPKTPVLMLLHHIHQEQFALYLFAAPWPALGAGSSDTGPVWSTANRSIVAVSPSTRARARTHIGAEGRHRGRTPGVGRRDLHPGVGQTGVQNTSRIVCVGRLVAHKCTASIVEAMPPAAGRVPPHRGPSGRERAGAARHRGPWSSHWA